MSALLDAMAFELYENLSASSSAIALFDLDVDKLKAGHQRHFHRAAVTNYSEMNKNLTREQLADALLNDKRYYRYIYETDVDWKQLYQDKKVYHYKVQLLTLSSDERQALRVVLQYQEARIAVGRFWSSLIQNKDKGIQIPYSRQQTGWSLLRSRNQLAYRIVSKPQRYQKFLTELKIKFSDLSSHSLAYQKILKRERQAEKKIYRQPLARPAKQTAYNSGKKRWQYNAVSQALDNMGESFYEMVLGMEGKREGGNHIRYGQGHAITYAQSGSKAGSWHSFASGEGGGPIQLLMSRTHGWGLSYEQALEEGARIARLSPSEMVNCVPKRIQVDAKQHEVNQEEKISRARYYIVF